MKKFAVIGCPVAHSLSPQIHNQFAKQFAFDLLYSKIHAEKNEFISQINRFKETGGNGLNVTLPFKTQAYKIATDLSENARIAQAVNTLSFTKGHIKGDNTDGVGLINDLTENLKTNINGYKVLIIGAGGAVQGILGVMLDNKPAQVHIANRTVSKAYALKQMFRSSGRIYASGLQEVNDDDFDLIINASASSLSGRLPQINPRIFTNANLAYDMMYSNQATVFMRWALDNGAKQVEDGLGMLVGQASESFYIWHGKRPDTRQVLTWLRNNL